ncbi:hypothetical protein GTO89_05065 [Heliobacterium gestii]|uniref:Uncharacterized protein n=1 Tax=Heliomicrobium gestii TaxID=2699 RepID=A0A845LA00_HELGE|nr:hypothetical protein [Heliomicrobium gestii]MBM7866989.1 hypothetical protein [Heliomicrobium gestii]MZP42411.1 hypothetical protein [Heliomicrobium gestii]
MKEIDLIAPVVKSFSDRGYRAYAEVKLSSRWIDVYLINENTFETIAIELKLTNWKKAYQQAKVYPLVADYVYIGMPEKYVHRALDNIDLFKKLGVGILSVSQEVIEVLEPQQSTILSQNVKREVIGKLESGSELVLDEQNNLTKTIYPCGRIQ